MQDLGRSSGYFSFGLYKYIIVQCPRLSVVSGRTLAWVTLGFCSPQELKRDHITLILFQLHWLPIRY